MFNPIICDFFNGMIVCVPILTRLLPKAVTPEQVHAAFAAHYANQRFVHVTALQGSDVLPDGSCPQIPLQAPMTWRYSSAATMTGSCYAHGWTIWARRIRCGSPVYESDDRGAGGYRSDLGV